MEKTCFLLTVAVSLVHCLTACLSLRVNNITTDQSALLALRAHITSEPPFNLLANNWTTTTPICNWIGVTCNSRHQRVAALALPNLGLRGTIPPHMGNLSFLLYLDVKNNSFYGNLPKELARLHRLKHIDVRFNNFGGQIPSSLGALSELRYLRLGNNSFTGNIPQEIGNLRNLKSLNMEFNQLTGSIPATIFNISSLQLIAFSSNGLSGNLPADICYRLSKLEALYLSGNELDGQIPSSLCECSQLQILALSYNKFRGPIPSEIGNLTMLKELRIGGNNLEGEIPLELGNLPRIETLMIGNAGLTGLMPSFVFNISSLSSLFLNANNFFGSLPRDMCLHLPVLETLHLARNKLSGSIPRDIGNCTALTKLGLYENNLTGVIPEEIGKLPNIDILALNSNMLSGSIPVTIFNSSTIRVISIPNNSLSGSLPSCVCLSLPNLEILYLGKNNLRGTIPAVIANASKLTILDLPLNNLSGSIPNSLGGLRLLESLSLEENLLTSEYSSSSELGFITSMTKCRRLRVLSVGTNPLYGTLPKSIGNFSTSLEIIKAGQSGIMGNIPKEIGNLSNLILLSLYGNDLKGFLPQTIIGLQNIQMLHFSTNRLQGSIPSNLCHLPKLGGLNLDGNELFGEVPTCLGNITSLRYLHLQSNKFTSTIPVSLWSFKDLLELNLSSNSFIGNLSAELGNLKVAVSIDLSMNQFSGEIPITIGGLQNLVNISLARNMLEGPIPESFSILLGLEFLDLSHNNLAGAIPKSLEALSHLEYFNVSFNKLRGEIPKGGPFANFTSQSFKANEALCGTPQLQLPPCVTGSIHQTRRKRILLIICIPLSMASIFLALTFVFVLRRCRKRSKPPTQVDLFLGIAFERITYQELLRATDGFSESNLVGIGSFGSVYKGIFKDGRSLAIKVFNLQVEGVFKSFDTECEMLRNIRHRNLVKVISSCSNLDFKALILEYMPNGSLEKWLYSHNYFLDILQRLQIMTDIACALEYLHHGYSTPVVHRDLKPTNVLLDEDMIAYLSDFGIAKFLGEGESIAQTKILATFGYIAPEYGLEGLVSTKCDVYSYGIMLMETFTKTKPTDEMFVGDLSLKRWVDESLPNALIHIIDANLLRPAEEHYTAKVQCVSSIMELALNCSAESPEERMNMKDVLATIKNIKLSFLTNCEET